MSAMLNLSGIMAVGDKMSNSSEGLNHNHDVKVPDNFAKMVDAMNKKRRERRAKNRKPRNVARGKDLSHEIIFPPPENNAAQVWYHDHLR